jgi:hypothetical protein
MGNYRFRADLYDTASLRIGLSIDYTGTVDPDFNVHHWVAFFVTGYFSKWGWGTEIGNYLRECVDPSNDDYDADILLGNSAAKMGYAFQVDEFSEKKPFIQFLGIPLIYVNDWQHSFGNLFAKYLPITTP